MIEQKSWREFRETGLFWFVNTILHAFGWSLCYEPDTGNVYPARCQFRGFTEEINTDGYMKVSKYMSANAKSLEEEARS